MLSYARFPVIKLGIVLDLFYFLLFFVAFNIILIIDLALLLLSNNYKGLRNYFSLN